MPKEALRPQSQKNSCCRRPSSCVAFFIFIFAVAFIVGASFFFARVFTKHDHDPIATCNNCHCIVSDGQSCPAQKPQTSFPTKTVEKFASDIVANPYKLTCNPLRGETCETSPLQMFTELGNDAVCGLRYEAMDDEEDCATKYTMISYKNATEAEKDGALVTHTGACGVCSTTKDLAAYMSIPDITTATKKCAKLSLLRGNARLNCVAELGLTEACGELWIDRWTTVAEQCLLECTSSELKDEPNNVGPECKLNECMQCNEEYTGKLFTKLAGRTRRRSGLLSAVARPCEEIAMIQHEVCPKVNVTRLENVTMLNDNVTLAEQRSFGGN